MIGKNTRMASALAMALCFSPALAAQGKPRMARPPLRQERQDRSQQQLQKLQTMTPQQRAKALSHLKPERRRIIEERLQRYDQLSTAERERLRSQLDRFQSLPPARQQAVRRAANDFAGLAPERQQAVRTELGKLEKLSVPERSARMTSGEFRHAYSGHERNVIRNLSEALPE
jgi:uncharacterized protein DUF3106